MTGLDGQTRWEGWPEPPAKGLVVEPSVIRTPSGTVLAYGQLFKPCAKPHDCEPYVETGGCNHVEELR